MQSRPGCLDVTVLRCENGYQDGNVPLLTFPCWWDVGEPHTAALSLCSRWRCQHREDRGVDERNGCGRQCRKRRLHMTKDECESILLQSNPSVCNKKQWMQRIKERVNPIKGKEWNASVHTTASNQPKGTKREGVINMDRHSITYVSVACTRVSASSRKKHCVIGFLRWNQNLHMHIYQWMTMREHRRAHCSNNLPASRWKFHCCSLVLLISPEPPTPSLYNRQPFVQIADTEMLVYLEWKQTRNSAGKAAQKKENDRKRRWQKSDRKKWKVEDGK